MASDTAPPHEALERSPVGRGAPVRVVARDLEAIFGAAPTRTGPAHPPPRLNRGSEETPRASRLAAAGVFASAAFLGLAAGAFLVTRGPERPAAPSRQPLRVEVARPAPLTPPLGPLDPRPAGAAPQAPSATAATIHASPERASPRPHRVARDAGLGAGAGYADITAADRRLRGAYAAAIRAGVPRPALVSYRDRWDAVRRTRAHDPRRLSAGYGALAAELDRAAARARRDEGRRRFAVRGSRKPRYAPWWS